MEHLHDLAWPFVALVAVIFFREPLTAFLSVAGGRLSKFKVFNVEIELASNATSTPLLNEIHTIASPAEISESGPGLTANAKATDPADYAIIDLGEGEEWITSRLYLAAVMMERMRRLQAFVFIKRTNGDDRQFVALSSVRQLRWALAQRFPWLEAAWVRANLQIFIMGIDPTAPDVAWIPDPRTLYAGAPIFTSEFGAIEPWSALGVIKHYLTCLQEDAPNPATNRPDWTDLSRGRSERGVYVTPTLLKALLPPLAFEAWAPDLRDAPRASQTRAILRRKGDFVALLDQNHRFMRVANRRALLDDVGVDLGAEPET